MDVQKVDLFIASNSSKFPNDKLGVIREKLLSLDDSKFIIVQSLSYKDPIVILIFSIFLGSFGVDRFLLGDVGLGIGKLLTFGGCGIWTIVDWFLVMDKARQINFDKLMGIR